MKMKSLPLLLTLLLAPASALLQAEEPRYSQDEPEITIRKGTEGQVYYDYRLNGEVVEIKVVPANGKPYYLVPSEAKDGYIRLDRSQLLIPKWVLFRW